MKIINSLPKNSRIIFNRLQNIVGLFILLLSISLYIWLYNILNTGASWDEGFHLMGYLKQQPIGNFISDFWYIVRGVFPWLSDDPIMELRYIRYILGLFSIVLFAYSSHRWLVIKLGQRISPLLYMPLVLFSSILTFQFASPTLYYDNIQSIIYILVFSFYFLFVSIQKKTIKYIFLILIGFFSLFGLFNYLPSGLLLILIIGILFLLDYQIVKQHTKIYLVILHFSIGFFIAVLYYNFCIHNIANKIDLTIRALNQIGTNTADPHSNISLLINLKNYIIQILKLYIPIVVFLVLILFLLRKISQITHKYINREYLRYIVFGCIILIFSCILFRYTHSFGNNLLILSFLPYMLFLLVYKSYKFTCNDFATLFLLFLIPIAGQFGTDLNMSRKLVFFVPLWTLIFGYLLGKTKSSSYKLFFTAIFCLVYGFNIYNIGSIYQVSVYTNPKLKEFRPTETMNTAKRGRNIRVTKYYKDRFNDIQNILIKEGFKEGDILMIFDSNTMIAYFSGAYLPTPLTYSFSGYIGQYGKLHNYIVIFDKEVGALRSYCKSLGVNLDLDYTFYPMRGGWSWDSAEKGKLAIFCKKHKENAENIHTYLYLQ